MPRVRNQGASFMLQTRHFQHISAVTWARRGFLLFRNLDNLFLIFVVELCAIFGNYYLYFFPGS